MHSNILTSLSVLASVTAAAPAATAPWVATNAVAFIEEGFFPDGASFDLSVPAGNTPGSPGFAVHCDAIYAGSTTPAADDAQCTFSGGTQPAYSSVYAYVDQGKLTVNVSHEWLAADGYRRLSTAVGTLPAKPDFGVTYGTIDLQVVAGVATVPGLIGHFGTWSATDADFLRDGAGRPRGMKYTLSAPSGYALDAPGFDVSCVYDYNPDTTVYPACTPVGGAVAAGSQVSLWASVLYNITTVHHQWTAANGTKYQLVGTSAPLPNLGKATTAFTISPDVLNTL
ncbi:hypothetical protein F4782DRAFT_529374 [Xylaria castorea]|nr:hypothetical protein F4782DRAFT_529374 [Xylaria castorea]